MPYIACESGIRLCCLKLIVKLKYRFYMDNIADIEASIAEERFIEDNALFKCGQRVHTWLNDKLVVGIIVLLLVRKIMIKRRRKKRRQQRYRRK